MEVELADTGDVVEHCGELASHGLDLVIAERQAGQAGDVQDFISGNHRGAF